MKALVLATALFAPITIIAQVRASEPSKAPNSTNSPLAVPLKQFIAVGALSDSPHSSVEKSTHASFSMSFPRFDVYSPQGFLLYHTDDIDQVHRFLSRSPRNLKHLRPIAGTDSWQAIASRFHLGDPSAWKSSHKRYVFLSILLVNCEACSIEQRILEKHGPRLSARGIEQETLVLSP